MPAPLDRPGWTALVQPDAPCNDGPMNRHAPDQDINEDESNAPGFNAMAVRFVKHGS